MNKIKLSILVSGILIILFSCVRDVPNVPIYINMNGFENEEYADDFEERLKSKLMKHGFKVTKDRTAPYSIIVYNFYYYEYTFEEDAPYDDCDYYSYTLLGYEYGLDAGLVRENGDVIKLWESDRSKEDEIKVDESYQDCTTYKISEPILLGGAFFRQRAIDIAGKSANIVAEEYDK